MTTADAGDGRGRRALFYSDDRFGLGHLRPMLATAAAVASRLPAASLVGITGSPQASAFPMPKNFDYVKLPTAWKDGIYGDLPLFADQRGKLRGIWSLREVLIRQVVADVQPHLVVVEEAVAGAKEELVPTLRALRTRDPSTQLVLLLYDIVDDPAGVRKVWRRRHVYDLLEELYDVVLVRGDPAVFDVIVEYGFSEAIAAKTIYCGYAVPQEPLRTPAAVKTALGAEREPLVVVSAGGGADGAPLLEAYLAALTELGPDGPVSFITTGPLMPPGQRDTIVQRAAGLPKTTVVPFVTDHLSYLNAADLVVSQAGYSTMAAVLEFGKRAVVVPRERPWREQLVRAERLANLGRIHLLRADELTGSRLAASIRLELSEPEPAARFAVDGLHRVAGILVDRLLEDRSSDLSRRDGSRDSARSAVP